MSACQWVAVEAWGLVNCTISVCMRVYRQRWPPVPPERLFFFFFSIHWKHLPSKVMLLSVFKVHVFPENILASNSLNQGISQILRSLMRNTKSADTLLHYPSGYFYPSTLLVTASRRCCRKSSAKITLWAAIFCVHRGNSPACLLILRIWEAAPSWAVGRESTQC